MSSMTASVAAASRSVQRDFTAAPDLMQSMKWYSCAVNSRPRTKNGTLLNTSVMNSEFQPARKPCCSLAALRCNFSPCWSASSLPRLPNTSSLLAVLRQLSSLQLTYSEPASPPLYRKLVDATSSTLLENTRDRQVPTTVSGRPNR